jgi:hypothetical protein
MFVSRDTGVGRYGPTDVLAKGLVMERCSESQSPLKYRFTKLFENIGVDSSVSNMSDFYIDQALFVCLLCMSRDHVTRDLSLGLSSRSMCRTTFGAHSVRWVAAAVVAVHHVVALTASRRAQVVVCSQ